MDAFNETRTNRENREPFLSDIDRALRDAPTPQPIPFPEIAGYRVLRKRGEGGQGTVFEAEELATHRRVCIKVLRDRDLAQDADRARFDLEIRTLAAIRHDAIVPIFSAGQTASGAQYCVMPLIEGAPITHYAAVKCPGPREVLALMAEVCRAIGHVHRNAHMIHRDLKPSNILVDAEGKPTVLDFGLARPLGVQLSGLTQSREVLGTAAYMSPEQTRESSNKLTATSDVYSLGVVLFELLTGQLPYRVQPDNWVASTLIIQHEEPLPPSRILRAAGGSTGSRAQRIDADVDTIVLKALGKAPQHRYADAIELADDIERHLRGEAIVARRPHTAYVAYRRSRKFVASNVLAIHVLVVLVATVVTQRLGIELVFNYSPINTWFLNAVAAATAQTAAPATLDHVRIVRIANDEMRHEAARLAGVRLKPIDVPLPMFESSTTSDMNAPPPITAPTDWPFRRVLARFMDRIAELPQVPPVLFYCVTFTGDSPADEEFVASARRLADRGCKVIVSSERFGPAAAEQPRSLIQEHVPSWPFHAKPDSPFGWALTLGVARDAADVELSAPLAAFAELSQAGATHAFVIAPNSYRATIRHTRGSAGDPARRSEVTTFRYSATGPAAETADGVAQGDWILALAVFPPPPEVTDESSIGIDTALGMSDEQLGRFLGPRAVCVGLEDFPKPFVKDLQGRDRPKYLVAAAGIDQLRADRVLSTIGDWSALWVVAVCSGLGALFGYRMALRRRLLVTSTLITAIVFVAAALVAACWVDVLCNPAVPTIGLCCAAALAAAMQRVYLDECHAL